MPGLVPGTTQPATSPLTKTSASAPAPTPAAPSQIDDFLAALGQQESGGNYTASNPSGASGAFQFEPATWAADANQYGYSQYAAGGAAAAPASVQDAVAQDAVQAYYNQYGNWGDVAEAWYGGPGAVGKPTESGGAGYPTVGQYANDVLGLMGSGGGAADIFSNLGATPPTSSSQNSLDAALGSQTGAVAGQVALQNQGLAGEQALGYAQQQITDQQLSQQLNDTLQSLGLSGQQLNLQQLSNTQQGTYESGQYGLTQQQQALSKLAEQQSYQQQMEGLNQGSAAAGTLNTGFVLAGQDEHQRGVPERPQRLGYSGAAVGADQHLSAAATGGRAARFGYLPQAARPAGHRSAAAVHDGDAGGGECLRQPGQPDIVGRDRQRVFRVRPGDERPGPVPRPRLHQRVRIARWLS